jgi:predicted DNA-binding transcriptional regulator AlpA
LAKSRRLYTAKETAKKLGISRPTLRRLVNLERGPTRVKGNKRFYFTAESIERWINLRADRGELPRVINGNRPVAS